MEAQPEPAKENNKQITSAAPATTPKIKNLVRVARGKKLAEMNNKLAKQKKKQNKRPLPPNLKLRWFLLLQKATIQCITFFRLEAWLFLFWVCTTNVKLF